MSYVRTVGKFEVERDMLDGKTYISDMSGELLKVFSSKDTVSISRWLHKHNNM